MEGIGWHSPKRSSTGYKVKLLRQARRVLRPLLGLHCITGSRERTHGRWSAELQCVGMGWVTWARGRRAHERLGKSRRTCSTRKTMGGGRARVLRENEIERATAEHASYDGQVNKPFQKVDDGES